MNDSEYISDGHTSYNGRQVAQNCSLFYQTIHEDDYRKKKQSVSVEMLAVTLDKDYSAGDIADVLDNMDHDRNNTTFDLEKPNSNIVIDGTTLSFDADFSESDACGTHSNVYPSVGKVSDHLDSIYREEDNISFVSSRLSFIDSIGLDETKVLDEPVFNNAFNKTYCLQDGRDKTSSKGYTESDSEIDVTLCPDVLQDITKTSVKRNDAFPNEWTPKYRNNHSNSNTGFSTDYFEEYLCDIDQYTLTISNESNKTELTGTIEESTRPYSSFEDSHTFVSCIDDPSQPVSTELRNKSFRIAMDNSMAGRCDNTDEFINENLNDYMEDMSQHNEKGINETVVYF